MNNKEHKHTEIHENKKDSQHETNSKEEKDNFKYNQSKTAAKQEIKNTNICKRNINWRTLLSE